MKVKHKSNFAVTSIAFLKNCIYNFTNLLLVLVILFCVSNFNQLRAQDIGVPIIQNFKDKVYKSHAQVWSIEQDDRGVMFFGTSSHVVEYDGTSWRRIHLDTRTMVRSLSKGVDGRIYVGATGTFGVLVNDSLGKLKYRSLSERLKKQKVKFNDVWETVATEKGVYFRTAKKLFRYQAETDSLFQWKPVEKRFNPIFFMPKYGLISRGQSDLFIMKKDSLHALPVSKMLRKVFVYKMIPYSDHEFLCVTSKQLFIYNLKAEEGEDPVRIFETEIDKEIATARAYMGANLHNGDLMIGTFTKGAFLISHSGKLKKSINKKVGLQHNHVWTAYESSDGQVWLALDKGISAVNVNSPLRKWDGSNGFEESINDILRYDSTLYIAGMRGLYSLNLSSNNQQEVPIQKLTSTPQAFWDFCLAKFPDEDKEQILLASSGGLATLDENGLKYINKQRYTYGVLQSKIRPNVIFQTTANKVLAIRREKGTWSVFDTIKINGLARYLLEDSVGNLFIGTNSKGVSRIELNAEGRKVFRPETVFHFNKKNGLPNLSQIKPFEVYGQTVFVCSEDGIYYYNAKQDTILPYTQFRDPWGKLTDGVSFISDRANNSYYILGGQGIGRLTKNKQKNYKEENETLALTKFQKNSRAYVDEYQNLWLGGTDGLFLFKNQGAKSLVKPTIPTLLRKITIGKDSIGFLLALSKEAYNDSIQDYSYGLELPFAHNSLSFRFAAPALESPEQTRYRYFLKGVDDKWSWLSRETKRNFMNLSEGEYTFYVQSLDVYEHKGTTAKFHFTILPPWYRSWWAYSLYISFAFLLTYIIANVYSRQLKQKNILLEKMVEERTTEIREQNNVLEQQKEEIQVQTSALEQQNIELEKLSIVARETNNAISIMDMHGNFTWVNNAFRRVYGYETGEFLQKFKNILDFSKDSHITQKIKQCVEDKTPVSYESVVRTKSDEDIWLQTTLTPILDNSNNSKSFVAVDSDISELKKYEAELLQSKEEVEAQKNELEYQRDKLTSQHELISSSLRYAYTIQNAILPSKEDLNNLFTNFVLYRPKDIVSGDFYWTSSNSESVFIVVADCTGHGVPGAFMSMIGYRLLNEIIQQKKISDPAEILSRLDNGVQKALHQKKSKNKDGMDLILCRIDKQEIGHKLTFAGAKRPLLYYSKQEQKLLKIRGAGRSIGGNTRLKHKVEFENHTVNLLSGDIIYLSSDGFVDQNNIDREKYGSVRFNALLQECTQLPMEQQHDMLSKELDKWQNGTKQRDDITVMGVVL